jgi:hypothetical protein
MFRPVTWSGRPAKWMWFSAILELVLGGVFLVLGFVIPAAAGAMFLTGAILAVTGFLLALWARRWSRGFAEAQRIKATGVPGTARIIGMRQTGVTMNEQPQIELTLEVTTTMQGPYQVVMKEYVPMMLIGRLTSGAPLPVKVDPANPNTVIIEWESALGGGMTGERRFEWDEPGHPPGREGALAVIRDRGHRHGPLLEGHRPDRLRGPAGVRLDASDRDSGATDGAGPGPNRGAAGAGGPAGGGGHGNDQGGPGQPELDDDRLGRLASG